MNFCVWKWSRSVVSDSLWPHEFLCSHLNIKDERKSNIFSILCFIVSRKAKMQLKSKKILCSIWRRCCDWLNVSKVVFWSFAMEISHCMVHHSWVDQLKLLAIKLKHEWRIIIVTPHGKWLTYSKYPNQALKIFCTILVMLITLMFGFHITEAEKNLPDSISAYDFFTET